MKRDVTISGRKALYGKEYFITNTSTAEECPSKVKTIGLLFEDMEGLTIEGNGAILMFHGKMPMIAFDHCKRMRLQTYNPDFERPAASEMTYTKVRDKGAKVMIHRDTVAFVKASTMGRFACTKVTSVKRLTDHIVQVSFHRNVPRTLTLNSTIVWRISAA